VVFALVGYNTTVKMNELSLNEPKSNLKFFNVRRTVQRNINCKHSSILRSTSSKAK
jgi:hypothetical protein